MSEMKATRAAYGEAIAEFGSQENIIVMDCDLSKSTMTCKFKEAYPERFINTGIAEANMMSTAAGLASCGKIVFTNTFSIFAAGRAYEQVRNSICYPNLNVKVAASHAGITVGEDGASHQMIEDLSLMRTIPNMTVISPADAVETRLAVKAAIETDGPFYIRTGRLPFPIINDADTYKFELGKGVTVREGKDVTIIATGFMVSKSLEAAEILKAQGIDARVINIHTIKPIDKDIIIKAATETKGIVTAEEHNVIGGLGSAVAEVTAKYAPCKMAFVGIQDKFGKSGNPLQLLEEYGLTPEEIAKQAGAML